MKFNQIQKLIVSKFELRISSLFDACRFVEKYTNYKIRDYSWSSVKFITDDNDELYVENGELVIDRHVDQNLYANLDIDRMYAKGDYIIIYLSYESSK